MNKKYLSIAECINGGTYRLSSRNLAYGIYREDVKGFLGIREKFGNEFLFTELHYDVGPPCGTAFPKELLETCPLTPIKEDNKELFQYLKDIESKHKIDS